MSINETWGLISLAVACVLLSAFFSSKRSIDSSICCAVRNGDVGCSNNK